VTSRVAPWVLTAALIAAPGFAQDVGSEPSGPTSPAPAVADPVDPEPAEVEAAAEESREALGEELSEWQPKDRRAQWWIDRDAWTLEWKNGIHLGRNDGNYDLLLGAQFMFDGAVWHEDDDLLLGRGGWQTDADVRRARLFAQGVLFGRGLFKIDYEISESEFKDVYAGVREVGPIRMIGLGYHKEPFSLEQATSLRNHMFMERSLANALAPRRETGIFGSGVLLDARVRWAAGGFFLGESLQEDEDPVKGFDDDWELALRVTALPLWRDEGRRLLLVGFSYSHVFATGERDVRISSRPESFLVDPMVRTGEIAGAENLNRFGIELAWADGPLLVQGEWITVTLDPEGGSSVRLSGGYLQVGWLLTGERRYYGRSAGVFGKVVPREPFSWRERRWGAFEIAARFSRLDLDDSTVRGGTEWNTTLGLNWYLRSNLRFTLNWVHGNINSEGSLDVVQARLQFDL